MDGLPAPYLRPDYAIDHQSLVSFIQAFRRIGHRSYLDRDLRHHLTFGRQSTDAVGLAHWLESVQVQATMGVPPRQSKTLFAGLGCEIIILCGRSQTLPEM